ncbi:MAG: hypothetical protein IKW48_01715 [Akkermansia sp.]|nr:hypothetical protein [Akkermansia sp.]
MKKVLPLAAALLLACCQQTPYPGNPEYKEYTKSDLAFLQLGTRSAATGEVHCRFETTQAGEEETQRYPLTAEELVLLKNCLSKVTPAPRSTPEALSCRWKTASIEIRLLTINGRTLCAISPNTICSYSDSLSRGNTLLCLPDTEMGVLRALPTVQMAKETAEAARRYVQHYRLRTERAAELRAAAEQAASAEVELKLDEHKERLTLEEEEFQQLKDILAQAEPLPPMTRAAWNTPENHSMPLPPLVVRKALHLLDAEGKIITSIPLDYSYFAAKSDIATFTRSEGQGETAALPDESLTTFLQLPVHAKAQDKEAELRDAQLRD